MRAKEYQVVKKLALDDLVSDVNYWITHGWVPVGGVSKTDSAYMQAMVLFEPESASFEYCFQD